MRAAEQDAIARALWWEQAATWSASDLVFLDECGINTTLHRRYARAPQGQRAEGVVPRNWKENTTVIGALCPTGVQAVMTLAGALDRLAFEVFVEQVLVPTLQPGQIVIMDNLSAHKSAQARQLVEAAGCRWEFLPSYSPDFNPIEQLWSKFKSDLRREASRTQRALDKSIWPLLCTVTSQHALNWFKNCGYVSHYS